MSEAVLSKRHLGAVKGVPRNDGTTAIAVHLNSSPADTEVCSASDGVAYFTGRLTSGNSGSGVPRLDLVHGGAIEMSWQDYSRFAHSVSLDGLVQVVGDAKRSAPNQVPKFGAVTAVYAVDETPIVLEHIAFGGEQYTCDPPLRFSVHFDVGKGIYVVCGDFDTYFTEATRKDVEECLLEALEFDWVDIAMESDTNKLTEGAQVLRTEMLNRIKQCDANG